VNSKKISTVGDLRKALASCDDQEHIDFELTEPKILGPNKKSFIKVEGIYGWGGGRCITIVFEPDKKEGK
jgi:hypothetical protein